MKIYFVRSLIADYVIHIGVRFHTSVERWKRRQPVDVRC